MSFPIISKEELLRKLQDEKIFPKFFDPHATDVMSTCHYHTVKGDVIAGAYTFEFFVAAHSELDKKQISYSIGEVRLLAQQTFHRLVKCAKEEFEEKISKGIVT